MVVIIMLGEHAHAHFIEGSGFQAGQSLLHQRVVLMGQGVHRGAEGDEQRAVFIFKMGFDGFYQSVRTVRRFADFCSLGIHRACDLPMPFPGSLRQEADDIPSFSVIKALDGFDGFAAGKFRRQVDLRPAVRQRFTEKNKFKYFVLFHRVCAPYANSSRLH